MIRIVKNEDIPIINAFHNRYSTHELDFDRILFHGVEDKDGKIIVYGAVKEFNEIVISIDKSAPLRDQIKGIEELLHTCIALSALKGRNKLFAFAEPNFSQILQKHYGFQEMPERVLALNVPEAR